MGYGSCRESATAVRSALLFIPVRSFYPSRFYEIILYGAREIKGFRLLR